MEGAESNTNVVQVLVNYWEIKPSQMQQHLSGLLRKGVSRVTSFVPWQAVESDISHLLSKFLLAAHDQGIQVSLIITPEVGVYYSGGGIPRDLLADSENLARNLDGGPYTVALPPSVFALPSLFSQEVTDRYQQFLIRLDGLLSDLNRAEPGILDTVQLVMTGSYWKYYRPPGSKQVHEHSSIAASAFRAMVDQRYSGREFVSAESGGASRWKTQTMQDVNWHWFYEQSEEQFRARFEQFLKRRRPQVKIQQVELFTPEADPAYLYTQVMQMISGAPADLETMDLWIDDLIHRQTSCGRQALAPTIHWTGLGIFKTLSDGEKQYLLLKSILMAGLRGGGVLIDEEEWFSLPVSFRTRAESIARSLSKRELKRETQAYYLVPHCWSPSGPQGAELLKVCGSGMMFCTSLDVVLADSSARICMVDPSMVLTHDLVQRLVRWARDGRLVVLPRSPMYTDSARKALDEALSRGKRMELNLGVPYVLQSYPDAGNGKVVVYSQAEGSFGPAEKQEAWSKFIKSMVAIAEIQPACALSDPRVQCVLSGPGLFIMNPSADAVEVDLHFQSDVAITDLSWFFARERKSQPNEAIEPARRFTMGIPPRGVIPLHMIKKESKQEKNGTQAGLESV